MKDYEKENATYRLQRLKAAAEMAFNTIEAVDNFLNRPVPYFENSSLRDASCISREGFEKAIAIVHQARLNRTPS